MEKERDLARWLAGEMDENELREFRKTEGFATYDRIAKASAQLRAPGFDGEAALRNITSRPKKAARVVPLYRKAWFRVAAVVAIGLGIWTGIPKTEEACITADAGMTRNIVLPDASRVTLNSGSRITYLKKGWDGSREVSLDGEAFFHVSKGQRFEVVTDQGTVAVLGTQFNVRDRGGRFEVDCYEGKVKVAYGKTETILTQGQTAAFENGKAMTVRTQNGGQPGWMQNELVFRSETLPAVAAELERHFGLKINLPSGYAAERYNGTIPGDDPLIALHLIARTYQLDISQDSGKEFTLKAGE